MTKIEALYAIINLRNYCNIRQDGIKNVEALNIAITTLIESIVGKESGNE